MHLVQLLLPLYNNEGNRFPQSMYEGVGRELTERFGGLTAYVRSPATGWWKEASHQTVRDEIVIYEVMDGQLEASWWKSYRQALSSRFQQEELIVRASQVQLL